MSVGGRVVEVIRIEEFEGVTENGPALWVDTYDDRTHCAVYVDAVEPVEPGDWLWWQAGYAYWTPRDKSRSDVKIPRRSYSGVSRPEAV